MSRVLTFGALALAALTAGGLYQVKYQVQALEREANSLAREVRTTRAAIQVLDAEWSYFNQPDRLEGLNTRHLQLGPTTPRQIVRIDELPFRPAPAPGAAPVAPPAIAQGMPQPGPAMAALAPGQVVAPTAVAPGRPPIPLAKPAAPPPRPALAEVTPPSAAQPAPSQAAPARTTAPAQAAPAQAARRPAQGAPASPGLAPPPRTERTAQARPPQNRAPQERAPQGGMIQPVAATSGTAGSPRLSAGAIQQAIDEGLLGGLE
ncbi:cell division protein FtsL [Zavarzinia sp. CC-PAN008]|uniref:cell division protein FtsL n=1 Tax=Zavarzinia sp. CC-PAN008 TaxID=3243332 RepID=UPI003F743547